jgi:drug/metabolite transporter (DMT)-like permease
MSSALLLLILLAAFIHAFWNLFARKTGGSLTVLWLGALISTLIMIPIAVGVQLGHPFSRRGFYIALVSGLVHCTYWWSLARMYRRGDISLSYPIARGSGVLGTAVGSMLWLHESPSFLGATGIACVCAGVFTLGYQRRVEPVRTRVVLLALITGLSISAYSLLDDRGVQHMPPPVYLAIETGVGVLALSMVGWKRLQIAAPRMYARYRRTVWIVGLGSPATYLIILFAYSQGPVGYIVAVREVAVVFAALLGARYLKEKISALRWAGIGLVAVGMIMIKLA